MNTFCLTPSKRLMKISTVTRSTVNIIEEMIIKLKKAQNPKSALA
jgi:hypothetical protein